MLALISAVSKYMHLSPMIILLKYSGYFCFVCSLLMHISDSLNGSWVITEQRNVANS